MSSQLPLFEMMPEKNQAETEILTSNLNSTLYLEGLNEQQQAAVQAPLNQAVQILAGAGTGKTELISRRFVKLTQDLAKQNVAKPEERILVVTFTNDAAFNMQARIQQRLLENASEESGNEAREGLSPTAWICTFHQLCMRLLRAHALDIDLPPDFQILNPLEQQINFQRLMQSVLAGDASDLTELLKRFHLVLPSNILSIQHFLELKIDNLENLLDADRIYHFINRIKTAGLSPSEFLETAVQQSRRFTDCLKNLPVPHDKELDKLTNMEIKMDAWRSALHPWAYSGWNPSQTASEKAERAGKNLTPGLIKDELKNLAKLYLADRSFEPITPDFSLLDEALVQEVQIIQIIAAIYALYQETLLKQGACDFDDLINHVIQLLTHNPALRNRYQKQFEAIIVDEFQDSNGSQLRLLELLMREKASNLTVVGDEKQSIYAFRFAQPENLNLIFREGDPQSIHLQTNYRSLPPVLSVANTITNLITNRRHQHLQACEKYATCSEPQVMWVNWDDMQELEDGKLTHKPVFEQKDQEARFIALEIAKLVSEKQCRFSDIAVLVKSHLKAEEIQQALAVLNIPSVRQKNLGFFQEAVIKDAMAFLKLMQNLYDDTALVRILQQKLSQKHIYDLMQAKRKLKEQQQTAVSLFDVCLWLGREAQQQNMVPPLLAEAVGDLAQHLHTIYKQKNHLSPVQLFLKFAQKIGLIDRRTPQWQQKQQRLTLKTFEKLLALLSQGNTLQSTLDEVLDLLEQYANHPEQELPVKEELSGEDAVQIMTVFASKGLEFKIVFVAYTEKSRMTNSAEDTSLLFDPQYPGKAGFGLILGKVNRRPNLKREVYQKCWQTPRNQTEAQRIFYVALTRAKERLYVIRGSQSFEWTSPLDYPKSAVRIISETEDSDWLNAEFWNADITALRNTVTQLQEAKPESTP